PQRYRPQNTPAPDRRKYSGTARRQSRVCRATEGRASKFAALLRRRLRLRVPAQLGQLRRTESPCAVASLSRCSSPESPIEARATFRRVVRAASETIRPFQTALI